MKKERPQLDIVFNKIDNNILDLINHLNPIVYRYKNEPSGTERFGFISKKRKGSKLEKISNHYKLDDENELLILKENELITMLVKAIQEQNKEIEKLKKQIKQ